MNQSYFFDRENIQLAPWPPTSDGAYARAFLSPMIERGAEKFVANVQTELSVLIVDDTVFPITRNEKELQNPYICSPYNHYITYAAEEIRNVSSLPVRLALKVFILGLGVIFKAGSINRVVMVNNWLLSTNLYPAVKSDTLAKTHALLLKKFPTHAIVFRSVDAVDADPLAPKLKSLNYRLIPGRQIYLMDPEADEVSKNRSHKRDLALRDRTEVEVMEAKDFTANDDARVVELYNDLYLEKYSIHNPAFTPELVKLARETGILELRGLKLKNKLVAMMGFFKRNGYMTTPLFGYDRSLPSETGLYRLLMTLQTEEAKLAKTLLHQSSGAANFKVSRGSKPHLEYLAAYTKHLSWRQRLAWAVLDFSANAIAKPILEKFKL
jgi:hypothetical protein